MNLDHYFKNEEVGQILEDWTSSFPQFVTVETIGESYQKRPIWLIKLTNKATGLDTDKPAV
jgi:hypothetical protein